MDEDVTCTRVRRNGRESVDKKELVRERVCVFVCV
jgi:hypothetical protein